MDQSECTVLRWKAAGKDGDVMTGRREKGERLKKGCQYEAI
jgi:hypothetical protein